jgi:glycosyltransferase involved in cell wall biosynthesis
MTENAVVIQEFPVAASPLRVAVVTETYPPEVNGVAMTLGRIVGALQRRKHSVQLIRPRQGALDSEARSEQFEEVLKPGIPIPRYDGLKIGLPAKRGLTRLWALRRPDIVHIATEGPLGWSALVAATKLKLPVTTGFHTNFHSYSKHYRIGFLKEPITAYLRKFHNRALATLVPTESLRRELELNGFQNLHVVSRGVDTCLFSPSRRSPELRRAWGAGEHGIVAIYVGRMAPEKNLPLVVKAFLAMHEQNPQVQLVMVGDGPGRTSLASRNPNVVFAGTRSGEDLATHYASADVFLFPSQTETFGNVTLEAMASGLAVVAYEYAAAQQCLVHEESGLLAPFGDSRAFVGMAAGLMSDPLRVARLRMCARTAAERIDWEGVVDEFENVLRGVIQRQEAARV